ncbi:hypothetical protein BZA77DRAFT_352218 [Pyronema omphalodes]|nr:hypothetical protein BZA77DRAFT_352218 [Pyronema omphalodes]
MHLKHATTAVQDKLDANKFKSLPPSPGSPSTESDDRTSRYCGGEGQTLRTGKAKETIPMAATSCKTPTAKNGGRGKIIRQPSPTTPSAKWTWAEVVKSQDINVQILLGTGNLGLATPPTRRGERRGGVARRLGRKEGERERVEEKRGRAGPVVSMGNKSGGICGAAERGKARGGAGSLEAV